MKKYVKKGFTAIELCLFLAVVLAIAIFLVSKLVGASERSKISGAQISLKAYETGIMAYSIDYQGFPDYKDEFVRGVNSFVDPAYALIMVGDQIQSATMLDPWQNPYKVTYNLYPLNQFAIHIFSAGPDEVYGNQDDVGKAFIYRSGQTSVYEKYDEIQEQIVALGPTRNPYDPLLPDTLPEDMDLTGHYTFEQLKALSIAGAKENDPEDFFKYYHIYIGSTITVKMNDETSVEFVLVGFNHDIVSEDGSKAGFTFISKSFVGSSKMLDLNHSGGGYTESAIYKYLSTDIYSNMPDDLLMNIRPVNKISDGGFNNPELVTTSEAIWLLSADEIGVSFDNDEFLKNQGSCYEYFMDNKLNVDSPWWIRTSNIKNANKFCSISKNGTIMANSIGTMERGIIIGFCI